MKKYCGHCGSELKEIHGTAHIRCCSYPSLTGGTCMSYWERGILYSGSILGKPGVHYPLRKPNAHN